MGSGESWRVLGKEQSKPGPISSEGVGPPPEQVDWLGVTKESGNEHRPPWMALAPSLLCVIEGFRTD